MVDIEKQEIPVESAEIESSKKQTPEQQTTANQTSDDKTPVNDTKANNAESGTTNPSKAESTVKRGSSSKLTSSVFLVLLIIAVLKDASELLTQALLFIPGLNILAPFLNFMISLPFSIFFFTAFILLGIRATWFLAFQIADVIPGLSAILPTTGALIILYILERKSNSSGLAQKVFSTIKKARIKI